MCCSSRGLDEGGLPVLIRADSTHLFQRDANGEGMTLGRNGVFVTDVDIPHTNLQIVDDSSDQARSETLLFLLLFLAEAFSIPFLEQFCTLEFLQLHSHCSLFLLRGVIVGLHFG